MQLLGLAQGKLWMGDSRVAPYAVARWASCRNLPLMRGNVLVVRCGTLTIQTSIACKRFGLLYGKIVPNRFS